MAHQGVSTRRVKKPATELCGREFSRSTVSRLTEGLEEQVDAWAERSLDQEYPFLLLGCPCTWTSGGKRRFDRRPCCWPSASGKTASGRFWGSLAALGETGEAWQRFIHKLKERGLSGVELATSDAHTGLKKALKESFPGLIWQRQEAHFKRNVMDQTPTSYKDRMDQVLDQILKAASQQEAQDRFNDLREELSEEAPSALDVLEDGFFEATAALALPDKYRRRPPATNMVERFIQEIRRREKVIRIFPNQESVYRLVGALCIGTHEEWSTGRCYFDMEEFFEWKASFKEGSSEEDFPDDRAASTENSVERDEAMTA